MIYRLFKFQDSTCICDNIKENLKKIWRTLQAEFTYNNSAIRASFGMLFGVCGGMLLFITHRQDLGKAVLLCFISTDANVV